jgi:predicted RNA binding protein YcfA (HicA-like mRNA interferase family)
MQLKTRDIQRSLPDKGFSREEGDHIYFSFVHEGKDCGISTYISHGEREIGDSLISRMARQVKLSKQDFVRLVGCPMDHGEYVETLKEQGFLPPSQGLP